MAEASDRGGAAAWAPTAPTPPRSVSAPSPPKDGGWVVPAGQRPDDVPDEMAPQPVAAALRTVSQSLAAGRHAVAALPASDGVAGAAATVPAAAGFDQTIVSGWSAPAVGGFDQVTSSDWSTPMPVARAARRPARARTADWGVPSSLGDAFRVGDRADSASPASYQDIARLRREAVTKLRRVVRAVVTLAVIGVIVAIVVSGLLDQARTSSSSSGGNGGGQVGQAPTVAERAHFRALLDRLKALEAGLPAKVTAPRPLDARKAARLARAIQNWPIGFTVSNHSQRLADRAAAFGRALAAWLKTPGDAARHAASLKALRAWDKADPTWRLP